MQLTQAQKNAAIKLGWKLPTWDAGEAVAACAKSWARLHPEQQRQYAQVLGYDKRSWEAEWEGCTVGKEVAEGRGGAGKLPAEQVNARR